MSDLLNDLREKAADLDRQIQTYTRRIGQLKADLATMTAMMAFQEREIVPGDYLPHLSPRRLFKRNEMQDCCLEALYAERTPLDTRQLAKRAMAKKGMDTEDIIIRKKIVFSVQQAMKTARRRGFVESIGRRKGVVLWQLVGGRLPDTSRRKW